MEPCSRNEELEILNRDLRDPIKLEAYKKLQDNYRPSLLPRVLGGLLVLCGNTLYGQKPSYLKFRAVEIIARVPYHSWSSASFTLLTLFFSNEAKALSLSTTARFAQIASENETMHVVVISKLGEKEEKSGLIRHSIIPMLFAFFYFWASYLLYLIRPRLSYELNYLFESHAFEQYSMFLETQGDVLKHKMVESDFLTWYGRVPQNQYDFFQCVCIDELIHRNQSIEEIDMEADKQRVRFLQFFMFSIIAILLGLVISNSIF